MEKIIPFGILQNFLNDYLDWQDIVSCYKTSKFFQVLPFNRLKSKYSIWKGLKYCVTKQYFNEIKIIAKKETNQNILHSFELACALPNKFIIKFLYNIIRVKNINLTKNNFKNIIPVSSLENIIFVWEMFIKKHKFENGFYWNDLEQLILLNISIEKFRYLHSINVFNISKQGYIRVENFCWDNRKYNFAKEINKIYNSSFRYYHELPMFYFSIPWSELVNIFGKKNNPKNILIAQVFSYAVFGLIISLFAPKKFYSNLATSCNILGTTWMIYLSSYLILKY